MGISINVQFDELRALFVVGANLTLSNVFQELRLIDGANQAIPASGRLKHNARLMKIVNDTNLNVYISLDPLATTINDIIPAGGFALYDFTTNRSSMGGDFLVQEGGFVFAAATTAGAATGSGVYCTIVYAKNE